jgi:hypothetical protein
VASAQDQIILAVMQSTGGPQFTLEWPEAASQTFVKGELVTFDAAGYITEVTSDTYSDVYGIAEIPASNTATAGLARTLVCLALPSQIFEANMKTTALADYVATQADLGQTMAIQRDTTNSKVFLNAATKSGANVRVFVHGFGRNNPSGAGQGVGDTNARVLFSFIPKYVRGISSS